MAKDKKTLVLSEDFWRLELGTKEEFKLYIPLRKDEESGRIWPRKSLLVSLAEQPVFLLKYK